jgi:nicotinic acid mononucleotide adenylyltransferase
MLELALNAYPNLKVIELPDKNFTYTRTMPRLMTRFTGDELHLLFGSDVLTTMHHWPHHRALLGLSGLVVGVRAGQSKSYVEAMAGRLPQPKHGLIILQTARHEISSAEIREAIGRGDQPEGGLEGVLGYVREHWLYQRIPE